MKNVISGKMVENIALMGLNKINPITLFTPSSLPLDIRYAHGGPIALLF